MTLINVRTPPLANSFLTFRFGPALALGCGPALAWLWPAFGPALARLWPAFGTALARLWPEQKQLQQKQLEEKQLEEKTARTKTAKTKQLEQKNMLFGVLSPVSF